MSYPHGIKAGVDVIIRATKTKAQTMAALVANPPITPDVTLMCDACRTPTRHAFVIFRRFGLSSFEQIYRCTCCKIERRYGLL